MLRHAITPSLILISALTLACSPRDSSQRTASVSDTTASAESAPASRMATKIGEVRGLQAPEAARWDFDQNVWFVANINGDPFGKDNNGFITRLTSEGKVDSLKFIAGGRGGVTLNAPKGMAIVGDSIWVADIDAVRAFNKRTGAAAGSVRLPGAKFLNDIAAGPDGTLYITDSGFGPKFSHPGPDRIYQIKGGKATVLFESKDLAGPNGIAVHGRRAAHRALHGHQYRFVGPGRESGAAGRHRPRPVRWNRNPARQSCAGHELG